jgi:hypothetical protein
MSIVVDKNYEYKDIIIHIMKNNKPAFWVTNFSKRNISLADLNLTIKAFTSVNLLDTRHYDYTKERLETCKNSGSLFRRKDVLVVREVAPMVIKMSMPFNRETFLPSRERSVLVIHEENYEELNVSDEEFAKDNADTAELDTQPMIKKV